MSLRTPPIHEALVARLQADLRPVRPLWSPRARLATWLGLGGAVIAIAMAAGLRHDLGLQLGRPLYLLEIVTLVGAAAAAAAAAFRGTVPGADGGRWGEVALVFGLSSGVLLLMEPAGPHPAESFLWSGLRCTFYITTFGLLPWITLLAAAGRGAPLDGRATGALAGAAAFLIGAAAVRVACPIDDPGHVLAWHLVPVVAWIVLSGVVGSVWLVRWQHAGSAVRPRRTN
jgi:hypothetical protein